MYRKLNPDRILTTAAQFRDRVIERFPDSSLSHVAEELLQVSRRSIDVASQINRPNLWLRTGTTLLLLILACVLFLLARQTHFSTEVDRFTELLQAMDSGLNSIIVLGGGVYFLVSLEERIKRRRVLRLIHELRSLAHVVDMHQLTKDPELILRSGSVSPDRKREMTSADLARYLNLCSEMLTIISKVAALQVQDYSDSAALSGVDQIEDLTTGLCNKIWQKIMILERSAGARGAARGSASSESAPTGI